LYGKPVEITTIENLASDLHDQFFDVKDNLPNLTKALNTAMDMAEHLRWKGFSEISKEDFTKMFNDLVRLFKEEVSSYIDVNFEDIEVTVFIESDAEFASDDAVESYADEENDIEEKDIDDAMREELERKAFAETKIDMIKEFIFTII
jgi:CRISPR/Cas system type I-B associated protein Csh2 (Cas7 group RAMP superfamily)